MSKAKPTKSINQSDAKKRSKRAQTIHKAVAAKTVLDSAYRNMPSRSRAYPKTNDDPDE